MKLSRRLVVGLSLTAASVAISATAAWAQTSGSFSIYAGSGSLKGNYTFESPRKGAAKWSGNLRSGSGKAQYVEGRLQGYPFHRGARVVNGGLSVFDIYYTDTLRAGTMDLRTCEERAWWFGGDICTTKRITE
jgi:hypothetical protein